MSEKAKSALDNLGDDLSQRLSASGCHLDRDFEGLQLWKRPEGGKIEELLPQRKQKKFLGDAWKEMKSEGVSGSHYEQCSQLRFGIFHSKIKKKCKLMYYQYRLEYHSMFLFKG